MELRLEAPDWKMPVPVIETERLRLRLPRAEDLQSSLALWREPEVYRHITKKPSTEMESWARLMRYAGHWAWLGHGFFAVEEKSTGQYVGEVGSGDFRRDIDAPRMKGAPEIGWVLHPKVHGRGFATEALRAFLRWLDTEHAIPRTTCLIDPPNTASINVAKKLGFLPIGSGLLMGDVVHLYERIRP